MERKAVVETAQNKRVDEISAKSAQNTASDGTNAPEHRKAGTSYTRDILQKRIGVNQGWSPEKPSRGFFGFNPARVFHFQVKRAGFSGFSPLGIFGELTVIHLLFCIFVKCVNAILPLIREN